ncbi:MAG: coenzyme F420-0:L-glutamate ligase [Candidatus Bathyarchaeota archaeon]
MKLLAIESNIVEKGKDIVAMISESLEKRGLDLEDGDILALASKIVSYAENRVINLEKVAPSERAKQLADRYCLQPEFTETILQEADEIYEGVNGAILTFKNGVLTVNAGIDNKNAPLGEAVLWPANVKRSVKNIQSRITRLYGKNVGILIVDSSLRPLRLGTNGLALAVAGFEPIIDLIGKTDAFGKPIKITRHAFADDLASAAHSIMGEAAEKTPIVLIRNAPIVLNKKAYDSKDMMILPHNCVFMTNIKSAHKKHNKKN